MGPKLLYVPRSEAERLLDMAAALRLVEEDFVRSAAGEALLPAGRMMQVRLPKPGGHHYFFAKMCGLPPQGVVGFRFAAANSENVRRGLPESFRYIVLADMTSGCPLGLVDETWSWALRTGAEAGVAARFLARPGSARVGLVGAGLMAEMTLRALCEVLPVREARVTSRRPQTRQDLAERMGKDLGIDIRAVPTIDEALEGADVVVTATTANAPLVKAHALPWGCLILSLGTYQELDPGVFRCVTKVVPDDREKCKIWGDIAEALRAGTLREGGIYAELGEIVAGKRPGRERDDENILAVPQGMITQDVALAHFIYERAREKGLGRWLEL